MKLQIKKITGVLLACAELMAITSCSEFEEINKNPYYSDTEMEQLAPTPRATTNGKKELIPLRSFSM